MERIYGPKPIDGDVALGDGATGGAAASSVDLGQGLVRQAGDGEGEAGLLITTQGGPPVALDPVVHRLELDTAGWISLDGVALDPAALLAKLAAIPAEPASYLHLRADGETPYAAEDGGQCEVRGGD